LAAASVRTAGRTGLAAAWQRVRDGSWSVVQCALAAVLAWAFATEVLGHSLPFFACVAAVVCLGVRAAQRLRRVGELAVGVTVGVAVGDLLVEQIGTGAWQIGLVVGVALLLALALDGGPLLTAQAGLQAVFVVALPRTPGSGLMRWEDALVGGAVALLVAALLPADPWRAARHAAERSLADLAEAARLAAAALRSAEPAQAADALVQARATQTGLDAWAEALGTGRDITRLSPLRRDRHGTHSSQLRLHDGVDRASRNLRVLVRRVLFALETGERLPPAVADELDLFARAVEALRTSTQSGPPPELLALGAELDPDALLDPAVSGGAGLSGNVVVAQLRSAVVDLLVGVGISTERARTTLPPLH
jgi:uncharacterized membrane protein YgaE (UPF0421/DUF939 family)